MTKQATTGKFRFEKPPRDTALRHWWPMKLWPVGYLMHFLPSLNTVAAFAFERIGVLSYFTIVKYNEWQTMAILKLAVVKNNGSSLVTALSGWDPGSG